MKIASILPTNINKINTSFSAQNGKTENSQLVRTPQTDIFESVLQPVKNKENLISNIISYFIIRRKGAVPKTEAPENITIPGTFDFRQVTDGTLLPKNQPVVVGPNAILSLAGITEVDLGSEYIAPFINKMKNGQSFTVGRNGDLKIIDETNMISGIHAEISKQQNQIVVKDMSTNGTEVSYNKTNKFEFVRNYGNDGKSIDENYLKTSEEVRFFLNKAIDTGIYLQSYEDYKNTVIQAHKIAYCGFSGNEFWYKKRNHFLSMDPYQIRNDNLNMVNNYGEKALEVEEIARRYGDSYRASDNKNKKVQLQGISPNALPINSGSSHIYPAGVYMEEYLKQMYRTSAEVMELIKYNAPKNMILGKIAEHYQYAANARPFEQINNSLFMNEVNTLLKKAGMKSMPHGILDHAAQRLQSGTFKRYFVDFYYNNQLI